MFSTQSMQGKHEIFNQTFSTGAFSGIVFSCSQFDGYSPILDGSIRLVASESGEAIQVQVIAHATNPACKLGLSAQKRKLLRGFAHNTLDDANIKVTQDGHTFTLATGGLSYWQSIGARMVIEVRIYLPTGSGDVSINADQLPIFVQSITQGGDIVLTSKSSPISVSDVDAKSLRVVSQSGSVTFEPSSEQRLDNLIALKVQSGMTKLSSVLLTPSFTAESRSGSININGATSATKFEASCKSGSVRALVDFMDVSGSDVKVTNSSGSIDVTMTRWSGILTTSVKSGSTSVKGAEVEKIDGGWRKGQGTSKAAFVNSSGSVKVSVN